MGGRDQGESRRKWFMALAVSFLLLPFWSLQAFAQSGGTANPLPSDSGPGLQQAIHDYILAHPEVLIQSLQLAKRMEEQSTAAAVKSKVVAFRKDLLEDPNAPVL